MSWHRVGAAFVATAFLLVCFGPFAISPIARSSAQTYDFSTDQELVDVHVMKDGSVDIDYILNFTNYGYLDGVDIGLPNKYYDESSATAQIVVGGNIYSPSRIHPSPNVPIGLAVEFDSNTISAVSSNSLTLKFHVNNPHMVYENEIVKGTVGIKFTPTWFDSSVQRGNTGLLQARIFFPEGYTNTSSAVYLLNHPWDSIVLDPGSGLLMASWRATSVNPADQEQGLYDVGAGFPSQYVDKFYTRSSLDSLGGFLSSLGSLCLTLAPILILAAIIAIGVVVNRRQQRKMASDYFVPLLSQIGAGPRRDLTAVEAAIALERPIEVVATMILFGLVKKGKLQILSDQAPMRLKKLSEQGDYPYENDYLKAVFTEGLVDRNSLKDAMVSLIKATEEKLKGFDYEATKLYYAKICDTAWAQVKASGTPEEFAKGLEDRHEWMMLDPQYEHRIGTVWIPVPIIVGPGGSTTARTSSGTTGSRINPQSMAKDYASRVKSSSNNMVSNLKDLSREITGKTNAAAFAHTSAKSGWGGGGLGGGFGGCACACACACAGGGR